MVDYLVVVPDPLKITRVEMEALVGRAWSAPDQAAAARILDGEKGRVRYFVDTSWNVKGAQE